MGCENIKNIAGEFVDLDVWSHAPILMKELEIIHAIDKKSLEDFAHVGIEETSLRTLMGWISRVLTEDDPIEYYVGYVKGKPVVRGSACYCAQLVGLYHLSGQSQEYLEVMQSFIFNHVKSRGYHVVFLTQNSPQTAH